MEQENNLDNVIDKYEQQENETKSNQQRESMKKVNWKYTILHIIIFAILVFVIVSSNIKWAAFWCALSFVIAKFITIGISQLFEKEEDNTKSASVTDKEEDKQYFYFDKNNFYRGGPFSKEEIFCLIDNGTIKKDTFICDKPVTDFEEFAVFFEKSNNSNNETEEDISVKTHSKEKEFILRGSKTYLTWAIWNMILFFPFFPFFGLFVINDWNGDYFDWTSVVYQIINIPIMLYCLFNSIKSRQLWQQKKYEESDNIVNKNYHFYVIATILGILYSIFAIIYFFT